METENAVTDAVETVATNLTLNKTVIIAAASLLTGAAVAYGVSKIQGKVKAKIAAARAASLVAE